MNINHVILIFISLSLTGSPFPLLAEKADKESCCLSG